jgi:hypothetical protein
MIRDLLGEPDKLVTNLHHRSGPRVRLYTLARIEKAEASPTFVKAREKMQRRSLSALLAAEEQRERLRECLHEMPVEVRRIPIKEVREMAIQHYNAWQSGKRNPGETAREDSDERFLVRITVNYVRHELTSYDAEMDEVAGRIGADEGRDLVRQKILEAIAEAYPELEIP